VLRQQTDYHYKEALLVGLVGTNYYIAVVYKNGYYGAVFEY
jgi:hypothetical protein